MDPSTEQEPETVLTMPERRHCLLQLVYSFIGQCNKLIAGQLTLESIEELQVVAECRTL